MKCPKCGSGMTLKNGKYGDFWGCMKYPVNGCKGAVNAKYEIESFNLDARSIAILQQRKELQSKLENLSGIPSSMLGGGSCKILNEDKLNQEENNMNELQQAVQTLDTTYQIAKVVADINKDPKEQGSRHYKIPPFLGLEIGDIVTVNNFTYSSGEVSLGVAKVVQVLPNEESIFIDEFMNWVVDKVHLEGFQESKDREDEMIYILEQDAITRKGKAKRKEIIKGFSKKVLKKLGLG